MKMGKQQPNVNPLMDTHTKKLCCPLITQILVVCIVFLQTLEGLSFNILNTMIRLCDDHG